VKHMMVALVWDAQVDGEVLIDENFFAIDAASQQKMISKWITDLNNIDSQITKDQPITEAAMPRLKHLFGNRATQ